MSFEIDGWVNDFMASLKQLFGERLVFVGLQGSYNRGEATDQSDIDMVVILDEVAPADLREYSAMLDGLPNREKACGFISGLQVLKSWEFSDLFQFYHDTTPILGSLDFLRSAIGVEDVRRAIRMGACNIYHICGHNLVHQKSAGLLRSLYKSAAFTVQAVYYDQTGEYVRLKEDLIPLLQLDEREILEAVVALKISPELAEDAFDHYTDLLFNWAGGLIERYSLVVKGLKKRNPRPA
ncbi:MAG: nucleotidyltransferase domain-containing protein [Anaerolineaceae bacterium]|nr:nucleotidyltransferase domain-containing protein [Anaerolineaceae bacterium]